MGIHPECDSEPLTNVDTTIRPETEEIHMRSLLLTIGLLLFGFLLAVSAQQYKISGRIPLDGEGGWDYLAVDSVNGQLYVSHGTEVVVVDLASQSPITKITGMKRIHGIAVANDLNRGFISDGGDDVVVIFDLKSHSVLQKVAAGKNPDGILYDPYSKRVFAFNGRSNDVTAIDAASGKVAGTVVLDGKPEFPVSDRKGNIYANIEDKSEIVQLDPQALKVKKIWPLSPCEEPSGLAIDEETRRLFSVCSNKKMAIVNADSGQVVATVAIGEGPDAAAYDPGSKLAFSSNGEGTLTVVRQDGADKYTVLANVPTEKSARTMALDTKTHKIYLSAAQLGPAPEATADNPHPRPKILPASFHVLVVSPD
jgi:DNA-binding beta-propeller fold protein YncE